MVMVCNVVLLFNELRNGIIGAASVLCGVVVSARMSPGQRYGTLESELGTKTVTTAVKTEVS